MFADTHCHLDFEGFSGRLEGLKGAMTEECLAMVVVPSVAVSNWNNIVDLCDKDERFFYALGLHPYFIEDHKISDVLALEEKMSVLSAIKGAGLVAVGEIGLDATQPDIDKQLKLFEMQLGLAQKYKLPVIVHVRKLHSLVISTLKKFSLVGGVVHAFSGSYELMMSYINLGFKIGVGPVITWGTSNKTRAALVKAPVSSLVLETDAPDMFVAGIDKSQASPLDVMRVFSVLNEMRPESRCDLMEHLWANSLHLFNKSAGSVKNLKSTGN